MNNKITFPRLATMLADRSGRSKRFSEDFLREFFALISESLEAQESVKIKGLGTFRLTRVEPRRSVDVTTGEPMEISGHTKVSFVASKELADAVNAPFEAFTAIEIGDDADIDQLFTKEEIQLQNLDEDDISSEKDFEIELPSPHNIPFGSEAVEEVIAFNGQEIETELEDEDYEDPDKDYDTHSIPENIQTIEASHCIIEASHSVEKDINNINVEKEPENTSVEDVRNNEVDEKDLKDDVSSKENEPEDTDKEIEDPDKKTVDPEINDEKPEKEDDDQNFNNAQAKNEVEASEVSEEITEEIEEFKEENSRRKNWVKGLLIVFGAAIVALVATFGIWYVFATNDFNRFFKRTNTTAAADSSVGFVVGKQNSITETPTQEPIAAIDSLSDTIQESELEEEVPTAPSDAVVYDTISTTRYLTTMAKAHYGNYNLWPYIYQENQSFLGHPDRIRPGTPVVIPKLSKYGVDPTNNEDIEKAKKLGIEIYARYGKKI